MHLYAVSDLLDELAGESKKKRERWTVMGQSAAEANARCSSVTFKYWM
jgi:hypothetical protein